MRCSPVSASASGAFSATGSASAPGAGPEGRSRADSTGVERSEAPIPVRDDERSGGTRLVEVSRCQARRRGALGVGFRRSRIDAEAAEAVRQGDRCRRSPRKYRGAAISSHQTANVVRTVNPHMSRSSTATRPGDLAGWASSWIDLDRGSITERAPNAQMFWRVRSLHERQGADPRPLEGHAGPEGGRHLRAGKGFELACVTTEESV